MVHNENLIITSSHFHVQWRVLQKTSRHKQPKGKLFQFTLIKIENCNILCLQSKFLEALSSIFKWRVFETVL